MKVLYTILMLFPMLAMAQIAESTSGQEDVANTQNLFELEFDVGFGASVLTQTTDGFDSEAGFNFQASALVNYYLNDYFGFSAGFGYSLLNTDANHSMYRAVIDSGTDPTGNYELIFYGPDFQETHKVNLLNIPVHVLIKLPFNDTWYIRGAFGVDFGFNVSSKYYLENGVCTRLYYPDLMADEDEAICGIPEWGLTEDDKSCDGSVGTLEQNVSISLSTQLVVGYNINNSIGIVAGAYWTYGLNDLNTNSESYLLSGHIPGFCYNSYKVVYDDQNMCYGFSIGVTYKMNKR